MARLDKLCVKDMKHPNGKCYKCGKEFDREARTTYGQDVCDVCLTPIDDHLSARSSADKYERRLDRFCEDCGKRIHKATPEDATLPLPGEPAGVCNGCGRELCAACGDWHPATGMCAECHEENVKRDVDGSYMAWMIRAQDGSPCRACPTLAECCGKSMNEHLDCARFATYQEEKRYEQFEFGFN